MATDDTVDEGLTPEQRAELKANLGTLDALITGLMERNAAGEGRPRLKGLPDIAILEGALDLARANPEKMPPDFNVEKFANQVELLKKLGGLSRSVEKMLLRIEDAYMDVTLTRKRSDATLYAALQTLDNPDFGTLIEQLSKNFDYAADPAKRGEGAEEDAEEDASGPAFPAVGDFN